MKRMNGGKKLSLSRESVRRLGMGHLAGVRGGWQYTEIGSPCSNTEVNCPAGSKYCGSDTAPDSSPEQCGTTRFSGCQ